MRRLTLFALLTLAGCATATPVPLAKVQHFTGEPYDVNDEGRRITGSVCGANIDYSVATNSDNKTVLNGFLNNRAAYIEVASTPSGRHVTGTMGRAAGIGEVDLYVDSGQIKGRAGIRSFDLPAQADVFAGRMTTLNTQGYIPAIVQGRSELARMPNADVAAILPALLNCSALGNKGLVRSGMIVTIGGPAGYDTQAANALH